MRSFPRSLIVQISALALAFFFFPCLTFAEDICCKCTVQNMTDAPTLCYTTPTLKSASNCATLPEEQQMTGLSCDAKPLTAVQCKTIAKGGLCSSEPEAAKPTRTGDTVSGTNGKVPEVPSLLPKAVQLNTQIPGFTTPKDMGLLFGTYVVAVYRYMISIGIFLTTVMFIWGAFRYLVGSGMGSVSRGKAIMKDAIIGLLLVLSANLILRTINPELVSFKTLDIDQIKYIPLDQEIAETPPATMTPEATTSPQGKAKAGCIESTFGSTSSDLKSKMTTVKFFNTPFQVHQLAAPDFQAAMTEIENMPRTGKVGEWIQHMQNMPPVSSDCSKKPGYAERGSIKGGDFDPRIDQSKAKFAELYPGKPYPYTGKMHFVGLAVDIDSCFNEMCHKCTTDEETGKKSCVGIPCALTDPKWNRIPSEVVDVMARHSIYWGGYGWSAQGQDWNALVPNRDAMHFEWHGICWK